MRGLGELIMKLIKRNPGKIIMCEPSKTWFEKGLCPGCGKHKDDWTRRKDWTCCSKECSIKHYERVTYGWAQFRQEVMAEREYCCEHCGLHRTKKILVADNDSIFRIDKCYYEDRYDFIRFEDFKAVMHDKAGLELDHIKPIAIGGEEYERSNVQLLCVVCHKKKTRIDMQVIARYRKLHPNQKLISEALNL